MRGNKTGLILRVLRVFAGKSQTIVANQVPMAISTLSGIERGQIEPTRETFLRIVSICGDSRLIDRLITELQRIKEAIEAIRSFDQLLYA